METANLVRFTRPNGSAATRNEIATKTRARFSDHTHRDPQPDDLRATLEDQDITSWELTRVERGVRTYPGDVRGTKLSTATNVCRLCPPPTRQIHPSAERPSSATAGPRTWNAVKMFKLSVIVNRRAGRRFAAAPWLGSIIVTSHSNSANPVRPSSALLPAQPNGVSRDKRDAPICKSARQTAPSKQATKPNHLNLGNESRLRKTSGSMLPNAVVTDRARYGSPWEARSLARFGGPNGSPIFSCIAKHHCRVPEISIQYC
jgi:hypothetical protein